MRVNPSKILKKGGRRLPKTDTIDRLCDAVLSKLAQRFEERLNFIMWRIGEVMIMRELDIYGIGIGPESRQRMVLLKEKDAGRYLLIWIGRTEWDALTIKLQGVDTPRPLSHDLLYSVILGLKSSVNSIIVSDIHDNIFYGEIILDTNKGQVEVDSRLSDALALAVRAGAPIYAEDEVLNKAGFYIDRQTGKVTPNESPEGQSVSEEALKGMSAFTDFINTLDLDDLDKEQQDE